MEYTKVTVINDDNSLALDEVTYSGLDFTNVPDEIQALQWNGVKGEIEFYTDGDEIKPLNQKINEIPEWIESLVLLWDIAKKEDERKKAEFAAMQAEHEAVNEKIKNRIINPLPEMSVKPNGN